MSKYITQRKEGFENPSYNTGSPQVLKQVLHRSSSIFTAGVEIDPPAVPPRGPPEVPKENVDPFAIKGPSKVPK